MIASIATSAVAGRTPDHVTARKDCHQLAPSVFAASYSSFGTFCSAARYSRMKKPSCFQVTYSAIIGIAQVELVSHDGLGARAPSMPVGSTYLTPRAERTPSAAHS